MRLFPEITGPVFDAELVAITVIKEGMLGGGPELLPGSLIQEPPQLGVAELTELAKPLKP